MSLEGLDGGSTIRKPSNRREALHGQMKGITILITGPVEVVTGSRQYTCGHTPTQRHMTDDTVSDILTETNLSYFNMTGMHT